MMLGISQANDALQIERYPTLIESVGSGTYSFANCLFWLSDNQTLLSVNTGRRFAFTSWQFVLNGDQEYLPLFVLRNRVPTAEQSRGVVHMTRCSARIDYRDSGSVGFHVSTIGKDIGDWEIRGYTFDNISGIPTPELDKVWPRLSWLLTRNSAGGVDAKNTLSRAQCILFCRHWNSATLRYVSTEDLIQPHLLPWRALAERQTAFQDYSRRKKTKVNQKMRMTINHIFLLPFVSVEYPW